MARQQERNLGRYAGKPSGDEHVRSVEASRAVPLLRIARNAHAGVDAVQAVGKLEVRGS